MLVSTVLILVSSTSLVTASPTWTPVGSNNRVHSRRSIQTAQAGAANAHSSPQPSGGKKYWWENAADPFGIGASSKFAPSQEQNAGTPVNTRQTEPQTGSVSPSAPSSPGAPAPSVSISPVSSAPANAPSTNEMGTMGMCEPSYICVNHHLCDSSSGYIISDGSAKIRSDNNLIPSAFLTAGFVRCGPKSFCCQVGNPSPVSLRSSPPSSSEPRPQLQAISFQEHNPVRPGERTPTQTSSHVSPENAFDVRGGFRTHSQPQNDNQRPESPSPQFQSISFKQDNPVRPGERTPTQTSSHVTPENAFDVRGGFRRNEPEQHTKQTPDRNLPSTQDVTLNSNRDTSYDYIDETGARPQDTPSIKNENPSPTLFNPSSQNANTNPQKNQPAASPLGQPVRDTSSPSNDGNNRSPPHSSVSPRPHSSVPSDSNPTRNYQDSSLHPSKPDPSYQQSPSQTQRHQEPQIGVFVPQSSFPSSPAENPRQPIKSGHHSDQLGSPSASFGPESDVPETVELELIPVDIVYEKLNPDDFPSESIPVEPIEIIEFEPPRQVSQSDYKNNYENEPVEIDVINPVFEAPLNPVPERTKYTPNQGATKPEQQNFPRQPINVGVPIPKKDTYKNPKDRRPGQGPIAGSVPLHGSNDPLSAQGVPFPTNQQARPNPPETRKPGEPPIPGSVPLDEQLGNRSPSSIQDPNINIRPQTFSARPSDTPKSSPEDRNRPPTNQQQDFTSQPHSDDQNYVPEENPIIIVEADGSFPSSNNFNVPHNRGPSPINVGVPLPPKDQNLQESQHNTASQPANFVPTLNASPNSFTPQRPPSSINGNQFNSPVEDSSPNLSSPDSPSKHYYQGSPESHSHKSTPQGVRNQLNIPQNPSSTSELGHYQPSNSQPSQSQSPQLSSLGQPDQSKLNPNTPISFQPVSQNESPSVKSPNQPSQDNSNYNRPTQGQFSSFKPSSQSTQREASRPSQTESGNQPVSHGETLPIQGGQRVPNYSKPSQGQSPGLSSTGQSGERPQKYNTPINPPRNQPKLSITSSPNQPGQNDPNYNQPSEAQPPTFSSPTQSEQRDPNYNRPRQPQSGDQLGLPITSSANHAGQTDPSYSRPGYEQTPSLNSPGNADQHDPIFNSHSHGQSSNQLGSPSISSPEKTEQRDPNYDKPIQGQAPSSSSLRQPGQNEPAYNPSNQRQSPSLISPSQSESYDPNYNKPNDNRSPIQTAAPSRSSPNQQGNFNPNFNSPIHGQSSLFGAPDQEGQYDPATVPGGTGQYDPENVPGGTGQYDPSYDSPNSGQSPRLSSTDELGQYDPSALPGGTGQYDPANIPGDSGQYDPSYDSPNYQRQSNTQGNPNMMGMRPTQTPSGTPLVGNICSAGVYCVLEKECNPYTGFIIMNPNQVRAVLPTEEPVPLLSCSVPQGQGVQNGICCQLPHPINGVD